MFELEFSKRVALVLGGAAGVGAFVFSLPGTFKLVSEIAATVGFGIPLTVVGAVILSTVWAIACVIGMLLLVAAAEWATDPGGPI